MKRKNLKNKKLFLIIGVIVFLLIGGGLIAIFSKSNTSIKEKITQKPTEEGAKQFAENYWKLDSEGKYKEMYQLISPDDQKLVSEDTFIRKGEEQSNNKNLILSNVEITSIRLEGNIAKATMSYDTVLGKHTQIDNIIFIDGNWYQKLEEDSLLNFYEVPVSKLSSIKSAGLNEKISIPAFDITIKQARTEKTITQEFGSRLTAQGKFAIIDATVVNTGKDTLQLSSYDDYLQLIDSQDRKYQPYTEYYGNDLIFSNDIGAGMSKNGMIIFEVPDDSAGLKLFVTDKAGNNYLVALGI